MYEKTVLPNGVRLLREYIPTLRSVSFGVWVGTGSRCEKASENGAAHFIEHMVFKGGDTYSAAELAGIMDRLGGQINAFTTKECTCFYGRVLDTRLTELAGTICQMLLHSSFDDEDVKNERGVILEEIDMYEDTPDDLVAERLYAAAFRGSTLARPILGSRRTLEKMDGAFLRGYMRRHYLPQDTVIAVSGSFTDADIETISRLFGSFGGEGVNTVPHATYKPCMTLRRKRLEQNHLLFGFPGLSDSDPDRYVMQVFSTILGGGMSSRLFQTVREKMGLCYGICSYNTGYSDTGIFTVYTALSPETEERAISVILREIRAMAREPVSQRELTDAVEQAKSGLLIGLESTVSRMNRLARCEMCLGTVPELDEIIARYDGVTAERVQELANRILRDELMSFSAVGRIRTEQQYKELFAKAE